MAERRGRLAPLARLLVLLVGFAVAGYAALQAARQGGFWHIVAWFALGLIGVDLVLWPLVGLVDRALVRASDRHAVPLVNYVRVPAVISGTLLAISLPLVVGVSEEAYHSLSGGSELPYLVHWLLVTAALFGASGLLYLIRVARARSRGRATEELRDPAQ